MKWTFLLQPHPFFTIFSLFTQTPTVAKLQKTVIQDICYAVPITADKLPRAAALAKRCIFHVCIDHPAALEVTRMVGRGGCTGWLLFQCCLAQDASSNANFLKMLIISSGLGELDSIDSWFIWVLFITRYQVRKFVGDLWSYTFHKLEGD